MKKLATSVIAALAICFTCAFTFAAAGVDSQPSASVSRVAADPVAQSLPAQLLTVTCGQPKGDLSFSEAELDNLVDVTAKEPHLTSKVCVVFSKRA